MLGRPLLKDRQADPRETSNEGEFVLGRPLMKDRLMLERIVMNERPCWGGP
jgi:hypothetical protein